LDLVGDEQSAGFMDAPEELLEVRGRRDEDAVAREQRVRKAPRERSTA
jgi:hypothetical protein